MLVLVELSGEHPTLPVGELLAKLKLSNSKIIHKGKRVAVAEISEKNLLGLRDLALSYKVSKFLGSGAFSELFKLANKLDLEGATFRVRARRVSGFYRKASLQALERKLGKIFVDRGKKVNLSTPELELRVILSDKCYLGKLLFENDRKQFEARKVQFRPFFSPISLHPRLARACVNLARIRKGDVLLDPFCGTGGILIEAALAGARVIGSDLDKKMVLGTRQNLDYFNIFPDKLFQADVGELDRFIKSVDAIVTDPPYGRSASTQKEVPVKLYRRAFGSFKKILKKGKYLVIILPSEASIELGKEFFKLAESHALRVHKSLTRNVCVYQS